MMELIARHIGYPVWEIKERAERLRELKRLEISQFWPREKIEAMQLERLREIVAHAVATCDYYREIYTRLAVPPIRTLSDLTALPIVSKQDLRAQADRFLSRAPGPGTLFEARTGGSTGRALTVYFDKRCQEFRNAAAMRSDRWAGRDMGVKTAAIWGNPPTDESLKDRIRNALLSRLVYLDTMALNEQSVDVFVQMWRKERPKVIFGHSHSIYMLACYLQRRGIADVRPQGIISTSMMLIESERKVIEEVFACAVTNRYGCEEVGLIAAECPKHEGLHINWEHAIVECLRPDGTPAGPGEEGEVVVTDLVNRAMPLIRYRIEDVAVPSARACSCGRPAPMFERIVGRVADFLVKTDGTLVAGVSLVERTLTKLDGIDQMQIVQESINEIVLNVVPGPQFTREVEDALLGEFREVFGTQPTIVVNKVQALTQTAAGKYRFSICKVPQAAQARTAEAAP
jgi:phenylacetate-CoA ligase